MSTTVFLAIVIVTAFVFTPVGLFIGVLLANASFEDEVQRRDLIERARRESGIFPQRPEGRSLPTS